ncbi:MAG: hypothetical protein M0R46_10865 [Candidatus Muirbacterium halophilum]|nr:hypothetical protein [Candidatus Muirbacterium halophilum]
MYSVVHFIMVFIGTITGFTIANFTENSFFVELFPENPVLYTSLLFGSSGYLLGVLVALFVNFIIKSMMEKIKIHNTIPVITGMVAGLVLVNLLLIPVYIFFINLGSSGMVIKYLKLFVPLFFNIVFAYAGAKFGEKYFLEDNKVDSAIVIDSNIIIDGRIDKILQTGFLFKNVIVPDFIITELQILADSSDDMKRKKGRDGLVLVEELINKKYVTTIDFLDEKTVETDDKLINLCQKYGNILLSNDYNLIKKANIKSVKTLFMKELEDSIKPNVLVGDLFFINLIKAGKEKSQAVGYLSDGTMIVAQNGENFVGQKVKIEVKNIVHTNAGKIVFGDVV